MKRSILIGASGLMVFGVSVAFAVSGLQFTPLSRYEVVSDGAVDGETNTIGNIQLTGNYATFNENRDYSTSPTTIVASIKGGKLQSTKWGYFDYSADFVDSGKNSLCGDITSNKSRILKLSPNQKAVSSYWGEYALDTTNSYYCPFTDGGGKLKIAFVSSKLGNIEFTSSNGTTVRMTEVGGLSTDGLNALSGNASNFSTSTAENIRSLEGSPTKFAARAAYNMNTDALTINQPVDTTFELNSTDDLKYYKSDVTLGGEVKGKKTVVVEGGNVTIGSNMYYADDNSLLVLIVKSGNGKIGSITVNSNVTNVVGTLIADGPLLSANPNSHYQLLIYGQLFTANTIGGSVGKARCPFGTPEYVPTEDPAADNCDITAAKKYDLARFRNLLPIPANMITSSEGCNDGSDSLVPTDGTTAALTSAWAGGKNCYITDSVQGKLKGTEKKNPLVIEMNRNIKSSGMKILQINQKALDILQ